MSDETDAEFLARIKRLRTKMNGEIDADDSRLLALARRGAAVQWRPIEYANDERDTGESILARREGAIGHCIMWWGPRDGKQQWMFSNMGQHYIGDPTHFIPLSALKEKPDAK